MKTSEKLKQIVKSKYGEIAEKSTREESCSCCSSTEKDFTVFADDYSRLEGYTPEADLSLGCGLPTEYAQIKPGDTVVDLGSGAGNDCFVARALTGESGRVIGLDFTEKMVLKAKSNAEKLGYENVEFIQGDIENIPIDNETADVVVSNCVMNLVPNKEKAFKETYRILKKRGHFSISDIVLEGDLPEGLRTEASLYTGCVTGAVQMDEYLDIIQKAGFINIKIQKKKEIDLPSSLYLKYLSQSGWDAYKKNGSGIFSITLFAEKPSDE